MGIFDGFNPSGKGTMFGDNESSSSNNFYDFLEKKHGLTEEGMFDLTAGIGEKAKAPEFLKAFFEYRGEKPEQNKIDQMMGNSGFIMGLSLMQLQVAKTLVQLYCLLLKQLKDLFLIKN